MSLGSVDEVSTKSLGSGPLWNILLSVIAFVSFLVLWAFFSSFYDLANVMSSPVLVLQSTYDIVVSMEWVPHLRATIGRVIYALGLSMILGTLVGISMGVSKFWEKVFQDYIIISMTLPGLFAVAFCVMYFGISDITPMIASALVTFGYFALMMFQAIRNVDNRLLEMADAFDIPRPRIVWRIIAKSVMSEWFAATRFAFAICWKIVLLTEFLAAQNGIGFVIHEEMRRFDLTGVLAWTVFFLIIITFWEYGVLALIEKRVFKWRDESEIIGF